jgi:putative transposase
MANTYTQLYVQFVYAVKFRAGLIQPKWKDELYKYSTGIIQKNKHKLIAINGMPDHVHILIGINPRQSISDLMQDVKGCSSKWINEKGFLNQKFEWQDGYGAFSYGRSQVDAVINYINNQEIHHKKVTFREEYQLILKKFEIDYKEEFIFKELI